MFAYVSRLAYETRGTFCAEGFTDCGARSRPESVRVRLTSLYESFRRSSRDESRRERFENVRSARSDESITYNVVHLFVYGSFGTTMPGGRRVVSETRPKSGRSEDICY